MPEYNECFDFMIKVFISLLKDRGFEPTLDSTMILFDPRKKLESRTISNYLLIFD